MVHLKNVIYLISLSYLSLVKSGCPKLDTNHQHYFYTKNGTQEKVHICAWLYAYHDCYDLNYVLMDKTEPIASVQKYMSEIDHHIGYSYCSSCSVKSVFLNRNCKLEAYESENFTGFHIHYNTSGKHELYVSNEINSIRSCECNFNETEMLQNIDEVETILTLDDLKTEPVETCSNWNPFFIGLFIGVIFFVSITSLYIFRNSILALFRRFPYRISVVRHIHLKHKVDDVNNTIASFQDLMKSYDA